MTGTPLALPDSSTVIGPEEIVHQKEGWFAIADSAEDIVQSRA
jgi:hypothetical protein